jgi:hypothetical protein
VRGRPSAQICHFRVVPPEVLGGEGLSLRGPEIWVREKASRATNLPHLPILPADHAAVPPGLLDVLHQISPPPLFLVKFIAVVESLRGHTTIHAMDCTYGMEVLRTRSRRGHHHHHHLSSPNPFLLKTRADDEILSSGPALTRLGSPGERDFPSAGTLVGESPGRRDPMTSLLAVPGPRTSLHERCAFTGARNWPLDDCRSCRVHPHPPAGPPIASGSLTWKAKQMGLIKSPER